MSTQDDATLYRESGRGSDCDTASAASMTMVSKFLFPFFADERRHMRSECALSREGMAAWRRGNVLLLVSELLASRVDLPRGKSQRGGSRSVTQGESQAQGDYSFSPSLLLSNCKAELVVCRWKSQIDRGVRCRPRWCSGGAATKKSRLPTQHQHHFEPKTRLNPPSNPLFLDERTNGYSCST